MATKKPYTVQASDTLDYDAVMQRLMQMQPEAPVPERSMARAVGDVGLALGQGVTGAFKSISDVVGADNVVSRGLGAAGEVLQDLKSDQSKAVARNSQERIKAAEASGDTLEEAKAYMGMLWDQPGEMIAQGVGSFATMGFGKLAQGLKLARAAKASGMSKEAFLATDAGKQAIKEAADFGFKANIGVGAAQGVGAVKGSQYEQTFNNAREQGMSEQDAAALATQAQSYGGAGTMQQVLGGGLGALAAGTGPIERMIAGKAAGNAVDGVATSMAKGFGKEFATEGTQGAQERFAGNEAAIDSGVLAPEAAMRGVVGQGLMEGTIGGILGGGAGAFTGGAPQQDLPKVPDTTPGQDVANTIRAENMVPATGPLGRAVNAGTEAKAQQAEAEIDASVQNTSAPAVSMTDMMAGQANPTTEDSSAVAAPAADQLPDAGNMVPPGVDPATGEVIQPAPKPDPLDFTGKTDEELQAARKNAQDPSIRKALATELQARRAAAAPVAPTAQPGYEQRNAERIQRAAQAEDQTDLDAITAEEHADGERHFVGTDGLRMAVEKRNREMNPRPMAVTDSSQLEKDVPGKLPADLAGAKERYNYGNKAFTPTFDSDVDRAAFIASQKTPSKRDADYLKFAMDATGMTEAEVRAHGQKVRDSIKGMAKDAEPGALKVPKVEYAKASPTVLAGNAGSAAKPRNDAEIIANAVAYADGLGLTDKNERKDAIVGDLSSAWGMTKDEVENDPVVKAALKQKPSLAAKEKNAGRVVDQVKKQALAASKKMQDEIDAEAAPVTQPATSGVPEAGAGGSQPPQAAPAPSEAQEQWTRSTTNDRIAIARAGGIALKPAENVARKGWADHDPVVQEKLARGIAKQGQAAQDPAKALADVQQEIAGFPKAAKGGFSQSQLKMLKAQEAALKKTIAEQAPANAEADDTTAKRVDETPKKEQVAPAADKVLGQNENGQTLMVDAKGVRYYTDGNFKISEPVRLRPTREGVETDVVNRRDEFKTVAELEAEKPAPAPEVKPDPAKPVRLPEAVQEAIENQLRKQRARIARLTREAGAADLTLEQKLAAQTKVKAAEATQRKLRTDIYEAEDAAQAALEAKNAALFAPHADLFPDAAAEIQKALGQNDELDAEMRSYEAKADKPAAKPADPDAAAKAKAQQDLDDALGELGMILTKGIRKNMMPEQERALLPVLTQVMDASFRLGYYKFKESARFVLDKVRAKFGSEVADMITLDHLQGAYIGMAGKYQDQGASTKKEVIAIESLDELADTANETVAAPAKSNSMSLAKSLYQTISNGGMPKDNPALKKLVEAFDGQPADQARMKQAQEELETAIAMTARDVVARNEGDRTTFDILLRLYESQPNLNIRTSTSIANQAYSTPAPLAFLSSRLAGITKNTIAHEPTGGTGMLMIGADPKKAIVNELNDLRIEALKAQGFAPTQKDAATQQLVPDGVKTQSVNTNPPFGSIKDAEGNPIKVKVDGFNIGQIDHLIAARALETLEDSGRGTLIIGANKVAGGLSTDDRIFFNWLYSHYNVVGHFEVDGGLYTRQGASWPVRVITINGRQKSGKISPVAGVVKRVDNWELVYEQFEQSLAAAQKPISAAADATGKPAPGPVDAPAKTGGEQPTRGTGGAANVTGASPRVVPDRAEPAADTVGGIGDEQRINAQSYAPQSQPGQSDDVAARPAKPAGNAAVEAAPGAEGNAFQSPYTPRSARKDEGVLIPANMAQPTQDALSRIEDEVGDIDEYARKELGYNTVADLHNALMGLQVDSVATSIYQIKQGKAVVIADQTGIGKGRQAASIIRWAAKQGLTPVFVSVKPSLFTDMYGDLADIGTNDVAPFILNGSEWISGEGGTKLFTNKPATHKRTMERIADSGQLPEGSNALFMTYSQINVDNVQRRALMALAPNAVFVLDESHNAAGASSTGEFVIGALEAAKGVVYLSATYAKRPDNMPLYFKTDIGEAAADTDGLAVAMASGGLPLQTVVSNNLVKAGQMFRRERSYDGVEIKTIVDAANRDLHERMSNEATKALRAIVSADRMFHEVYVKQLADDLAERGATVQDTAGNQVEKSVQHTEFSSVVHNFVKQMLLGLKAQSAADEAIASIKRGEKPIIAVESTMGSFLNEYAATNGIGQGESLGAFDYRTILSRALARSRTVIEVGATGDKEKRTVRLDQLDAQTLKAYQDAQDVIDGLTLNIPVSPIDWMRAEIIRAGYSVAEITGRNLSVDYSNPKKPILSAIDETEQKDKVSTTRQFNGGSLDALILNVAGSTGISLHASEKFADQRQRHMIVAQAAGDINIFMQMLGRVHRTGQVRLPKYAILNVDLPTEKRPTAVLSIKMKSLNANTSSNTESATSVKSADILNKYGDQIVNQYLTDNYALARALDLHKDVGEEPTEDIARKATGRLALQPIETQISFYEEVESQYTALIDYLNKTNQNDLEPRTFDFDAKETRQEVLYDGPNKNTPFGEDAIYGEYSIKAQGTPMKPEEIKATIAENLDGLTPKAHIQKILDDLDTKFADFHSGLEDAGKDAASVARSIGRDFMVSHRIGATFRVEINSEPFNAVIMNVRNTHKETGNPYSLSKIQVTIAINGALRSLSVPATQFKKIEVSGLAAALPIEGLFKEQPPNQRETAKIVTGNLLAAYGELKGVRGTIITFTKQDGTSEQGILLPKLFDFGKNTMGDYRLVDGAAALKFLQQSDSPDIGRFGIASRDGILRVLPAGQGIRVQVPKSKLKGAKYFLDKGLIQAGGDFVTQGNFMTSVVSSPADARKMLDLLMKKQALYALPSMAEEAKKLTGDDKPVFSRGTATDQAVEQWQASLRSAASNPKAKEPNMVVPMVLKMMGAKATRLVLPRKYLQAITTKHPDVPASVFENLPEMLSDPLFIIPHSNGGLRVFVDAQTGKGEPIFVGVDVGVDGRISTVSPLHDWNGKKGGELLAQALEAALVRPGKIYARNGEALATARASSAAAPAILALHRLPVRSAILVTRKDVVNRLEASSGNSGPTYSRGEPLKGMTRADAQNVVDGIKARWANAPEVVVVQGMQDKDVPEAVRNVDAEQRSQGAKGEAEGFFYEGKAYIVAGALRSPGAVMRVLFHEVLGHAGLRGTFGDGLTPILRQLAALRRTEILQKARDYGLVRKDAEGIPLVDVKTATDAALWSAMGDENRLTAAEEVLAEMAQSKPEIGFVKRVISLIRGFLRKHVPGFQKMALTDAEIIANYILPARAYVERGPGGRGPKGGLSFSRSTDDGAMFSRSLTAPALAGQVRDKLNETFNHPGKLSWWHKTVGSQYNLAERSPAYKRVFDAAQNFINDVSYYGTEAANMAPKMLPKLETLRDLTKSAISAEDSKAIAAPIFQGTLSWMRDETTGEVVRTEELVERIEKENAVRRDKNARILADFDETMWPLERQKQELLKRGFLTEKTLKMWEGQREGWQVVAIENKFKRDILGLDDKGDTPTDALKPGIVFTPAELKSIFKLTDDQVELYNEFRAATDTSLDNMAKAQMLRQGGKDVIDMQDVIMEAPDLDTAATMLRETLLDMAKDDPDRAGVLTDAAAGVQATADKINDLKKQGYAPLSRFGKFTVDVVVDGERQYFGMFETKADSNRMAEKMRAEFGADNVAQGTMSQKEFELFQGITPESIELFGNMLGLDSTGNEAQDKAFQTYLQLTKNNGSAMKRLIHRKGMDGYSEDAGRVLAAFVYANARQTSAALHIGQMDEAITAIPKGEGELKDHALRLAKYIKEPEEEAAALRGMLFAQYLGGSVASALVNMTQPLTVSIPYLSQFGGLAKAGQAWAKAMKDMGKGVELEPGLKRAMLEAEEKGIVSPQEIHQLMAQARGSATLRSGDGTRTGDAKAMLANGWTRTMVAWGKGFGYAEQINRRSTFIAAYRMAVERKIPNPGAFAEKAVNETQFINNKANKMRFGRGAIGATLMTFKSFSIYWLELIHRMGTQGGPEGKLAAAYMLGALFLVAGTGGLPFADDLDDLIDAIGQKMGYNISTKKAKQEFLEDLFGKQGAMFVERGLTGIPGVPIDVSGRLGMGNLIPGTGLLLEKRDSSRDLMELAGPAGDMTKRMFQAVGLLAKGEIAKAAETAAPRAAANVVKGVDMIDTGMYRDTKGGKVIDTTTGEAVAKMIGFQPASVSQVQESNFINQRAKDFYSLKTQEIRAKWAMGIFLGDQDKVKEARQMMDDWNENNPDQRMTANMPAIVKKVREMRKDKAQRIADTAPKALRAQMREDARELASQ